MPKDLNRLRRMIGGRAEHLSFIVGIMLNLALGLIQAFAGPFGKGDEAKILWVFAAIGVFLCAYQLFQLHFLQQLRQREKEIERDTINQKHEMEGQLRHADAKAFAAKQTAELIKEHYDSYRRVIHRTDALFRQIAFFRTTFDQKLFLLAESGNATPSELNAVLDEYLTQLCNHTASIICGRKQIDHARKADFTCAVSVKQAFQAEDGIRYVNRAYSSGYVGRFEPKTAPGGEGYLVLKHKGFADILSPTKPNHYLENNVAEWLSRQGEDNPFTYPNLSSTKHMTSLLISPIAGPLHLGEMDITHLSDSRNRFSYFEMSDGNFGLGFLSIDTNDFEFDLDFDLSIAREISIYAYSAILQCLYFLGDLADPGSDAEPRRGWRRLLRKVGI